MPHYRALFRIPGDKELAAEKGYVPDEFFAAAQETTPECLIDIYEGRFTLTNEMHNKLDIPGAFTSYAVVGFTAPEGAEKESGFIEKMLQRLKLSNHARPLGDNIHYQVFFMEYIDSPPEDD